MIKFILHFRRKDNTTVAVYEMFENGEQEIWFFPSKSDTKLIDKFTYNIDTRQVLTEEALRKLYDTEEKTLVDIINHGWEET